MKIVGLVQWTDRDKRGSPIAGVRPLVELQKGEWREIDAAEEFPSQGQIFWPNAQAATEDSLIIFRAEPNAGQKDEFKVIDPKPAYEVLDLRRYGTATEVRAALVEGIRLPGPFGALRALIWCKPDLLVGPVELNRVATGTAKLVGTNLHRLTTFTGTQVRPVTVDRGTERLLRVDDGAPSGFVDWDDDAIVLRRALEAAVRVAKQAGRDTGQTKKQIEEAARALASQGVGPEAQLDRYRLERALSLLADTEVVATSSAELAELLREHPAIQATLSDLSTRVRADIEQSARADLEQRLAREQAALREATEAHTRTTAQLEARQQELLAAEKRLKDVQRQVASAASEAEAAVDARVLAAIDRPLELLAEVSVLRPLLHMAGSLLASPARGEEPTRIDWSRSRGESIKDKVSLRRVLTSAARAQGVEPSLMLQVHAAAAAGLMPVTLGPAGLAALTAYALGACGNRLLIAHVSPSVIQPRDLDVVPGGGLVAAVAAAKEIDGLSLVVLEGANRSPLEASVVPILELAELGLSPVSSARGLRLAATLVAGATTVPVTSQLWSHAAAICPEPSVRSAQGAPPPGDIALSSELLALGDPPTGVVDALVDAWPDCRELRPALVRLGSALTRLYDEEQRVTEALLHGLVLPYIATALSADEQADALSKTGDSDGVLSGSLRRLRRRLG